jgi:hypothetical protein
MKYKFTVEARKWFDKVNGNTYHSVLIIDNTTGKSYALPKGVDFTYGYGEHYRQTAMEIMEQNKLIPEKYTGSNRYNYERENNYPINWILSEGLKRDMVALSRSAYRGV